MESNELYTCAAGGLDDIPAELRDSGKYPFPDVHLDAGLMTSLALALKAHKNDVFASVPFCLTVEAEALGGKINLGNDRAGPRVKEDYAYKTIKELLEIDYDKALASAKRVNVVMESVRKLSAECPVILNVNGFFTTLVSLIDINTLYKAMRSDEETVFAVLEKLRSFLVRFSELGLKNGAKVISYADPVGDITLMGAKSFNKFAAPVTRGIIEDLQSAMKGAGLLHLCGRMTNGLNKAGLLSVDKTDISGAESYGEGILKLMESGAAPLIGNYCIKKTNTKSAALYPLKWA